MSKLQNEYTSTDSWIVKASFSQRQKSDSDKTGSDPACPVCNPRITAGQIITTALESLCFQAAPLTDDQATAGNILFDAVQYLRGIHPTGLFAKKLFIDN